MRLLPLTYPRANTSFPLYYITLFRESQAFSKKS
nr:MAG TPA: hypothetical protein [Caudoviricetes sp.]